MNWSNVRLILAREIRDQLRDRRTLFMIAVLPLLLYPLLGMSFFQVAQFMQEHPTEVLVLGSSELDVLRDLPVLFQDDRFASELFDDPQKTELLQLEYIDQPPPSSGSAARMCSVMASPSAIRLSPPVAVFSMQCRS